MDTNLLDTHNRLVADVIAHFRTLTMLATIQTEAAERQIDPQTIAVTGLSMQMEFEGLVSGLPPGTDPRKLLTCRKEHIHQGPPRLESSPEGAVAVRPTRRRGRPGQGAGRDPRAGRGAMRGAGQLHPGSQVRSDCRRKWGRIKVGRSNRGSTDWPGGWRWTKRLGDTQHSHGTFSSTSGRQPAMM
jgi:hypothetical protein